MIFKEKSLDIIGNYGNRPWLDANNYQDMIQQYEKGEDRPRFLYMLTYQNHGGWEQNDSVLDTVHVLDDYGDYTDDVNEYLTSVQMSSQAFVELTEYLSTCNRHIIVCMVGDHAPSFISELPGMTNGIDKQIAQRMVPYIIWANYEVKFPDYTDYASMVDLVPMIFETADLPLTDYYQVICDLHSKMPIRTSNGMYICKNEIISGTFAVSYNYGDLLKQYYYMEYNALLSGKDYKREYFEFDSKE